MLRSTLSPSVRDTLGQLLCLRCAGSDGVRHTSLPVDVRPLCGGCEAGDIVVARYLLSRPVVVKILRPEAAEHRRKYPLREQPTDAGIAGTRRMAGKLLSFRNTEGNQVEVTQHVEGVNGKRLFQELTSLLRSGQMSEAEALVHRLSFILEYMDGVKAVQDAQMSTDTDVKRRNAVACPDNGETILVDHGAFMPGMNGSGEVLASFPYVPPEGPASNSYDAQTTPTYAFGMMLAAALDPANDDGITINLRMLGRTSDDRPNPKILFRIQALVLIGDTVGKKSTQEEMLSVDPHLKLRYEAIRELRILAESLDKRHGEKDIFSDIAEIAIEMMYLDPNDRITLAEAYSKLEPVIHGLRGMIGMDEEKRKARLSAVVFGCQADENVRPNPGTLVHVDDIEVMEDGSVVIPAMEPTQQQNTVSPQEVLQRGLGTILREHGVVPRQAEHLGRAMEQYRMLYGQKRAQKALSGFPDLIYTFTPGTPDLPPVLLVEEGLEKYVGSLLEGWIMVRPMPASDVKIVRDQREENSTKQAIHKIIREKAPNIICSVVHRGGDAWEVMAEGHPDVISESDYLALDESLGSAATELGIRLTVRSYSTAEFLHTFAKFVATEIALSPDVPRGTEVVPELLENEYADLRRPLRLFIQVPPPAEDNLAAVRQTVETAKSKYPDWRTKVEIVIEPMATAV